MAGYVASWLAKWTFAAAFGSGFSVFRDAFSQVLFRSMGKVDDNAPATLEGVSANFSEYLSMPFASSLIGVIVVYAILSTVIRLAQQKPINLREILFFFAVALSPVALYVLLKSHSVEHSWMTYRTMSLSFGVTLACMFARDRNLFAEPALRVPSPL
jgi:membrane-associated HD superfamily phosphohydrolase